MEQLRNHFHSLTLYTRIILKEVTKKNKGMKNEETPQHSSIKKRAVASPSVPIQFFARSPSIHVESSVAVKRCDVMLSRIKQLITKITAPIQNRVISALDIPSSAVVFTS